MISRLGYAILALLARQPSTGYELSARARRPLGYFWSARHSQIYPELQRLLAAGLVRFDAGPGPGPRDKKVYTLTDVGMGTLREWVIQAPESAYARDDLLLKAYAAWTADPATAGHLFASQITRHQERLTDHERDWRQVESRHNGGPPPVTHPDFGSYATLKYGIGYERQRIAWLQWISGLLASDQAGAPPCGSNADRPAPNG